VGVTDTPVTGITFLSTVTVQVAVLPPSRVVAVMMAVPGFQGKHLPGCVNAGNARIGRAPSHRLVVSISGLNIRNQGERLTLGKGLGRGGNRYTRDGITFLSTVTVQVAVLPPSRVVAVMMAVPGFKALTFPDASTLATLALEELQVTDLLSASAG